MIATHSFTAGAVDTAATEPPSQDDETADQGWKPDPGSATCKATLTDAQVMTITFDELTRVPCCRASHKQVNALWLQLQELLPCTIAYRRPRHKTLVCNLKRIGVKKAKSHAQPLAASLSRQVGVYSVTNICTLQVVNGVHPSGNVGDWTKADCPCVSHLCMR